MGSTTSVVGFGGLIAAVAVWSRYQFEKERNEFDRSIYFDTAFPSVGSEFPTCSYPRVWKNGMGYPKGFCGDDNCESKFIERANKFWKGKPVRMTLVDGNSTFEDQVRPIEQFLVEPEYDMQSVHFLQQMDDEAGYVRFFDFNNDPNQNFFKTVAESPTHEYSGVQMFLARGKHTGTPMHFAVAINYFAMVAGRKRWVLVDPSYLNDAECKISQPGHFGVCDLTFFDTKNSSMDEQVQMLKDAGVPQGAGYLDVTLEAGDVLQLCEMWPHAIENLGDLNVGIAIRTAGGPIPARLSVFTTLFRMLGQGIIDFIQDPYRPGTRMVKMMWRQFIGQGRGVLDTHPDESIENGNNVYNNLKTFNNRGKGGGMTDLDFDSDRVSTEGKEY